MLTVYETPTFVFESSLLWSDEERLEFIAWIAGHPDAGDVIRGTGGCRKVRWRRAHTGKRGGVRIIYFVRRAQAEIWLLMMYAKSARATIPAETLRTIRRELDDE